ncbi:protein NO VEIN domain-containing protein [Erythrobacter alti]|uniref:protein NO VEIN domain-containing protein n=1 Tax=Erythrobacter alti TaxID=1896145 RepID=UPI0030F4B359
MSIYYDSFLAAGRTQVSISDFLADFGFTASEAASYFEDDPASQYHQTLVKLRPTLTWQRVLNSTAQAPAQLPGQGGGGPPTQGTGTPPPGLAPLSSLGQTTSPPPPATSGWWNAQQAVRKTLENAGWHVLDTSAQKGGCDFKITKGMTTKVVEVKSSVGNCNPTLTRSEHARAKSMGKDFVLAIVENYNPQKPASILWVEDPASLNLTKQSIVAYGLPRSVWLANTSSMP